MDEFLYAVEPSTLMFVFASTRADEFLRVSVQPITCTELIGAPVDVITDKAKLLLGMQV